MIPLNPTPTPTPTPNLAGARLCARRFNCLRDFASSLLTPFQNRTKPNDHTRFQNWILAPEALTTIPTRRRSIFSATRTFLFARKVTESDH